MPHSNARSVALITGATGAFGSCLAMQCALSGWETILMGKSKKKLEDLFDRVTEQGGVKPQIAVADFTRLGPGDCMEIMSAVKSSTGRLDALVHAAASFPGLRPLDQIQPQDWLNEVQVNLNAPWLLSIHCLPLLRNSPSGSLYFLAESLEKMSSAYWGSYGASKSGLLALASQFKAELSNTKIQVHTINPGPMKSPLRARVYHSEDPQFLESAEVAAKKTLRLLDRELKIGHLSVNLKEI